MLAGVWGQSMSGKLCQVTEIFPLLLCGSKIRTVIATLKCYCERYEKEVEHIKNLINITPSLVQKKGRERKNKSPATASTSTGTIYIPLF